MLILVILDTLVVFVLKDRVASHETQGKVIPTKTCKLIIKPVVHRLVLFETRVLLRLMSAELVLK